jgi:hypothetical protein
MFSKFQSYNTAFVNPWLDLQHHIRGLETGHGFSSSVLSSTSYLTIHTHGTELQSPYIVVTLFTKKHSPPKYYSYLEYIWTTFSFCSPSPIQSKTLCVLHGAIGVRTDRNSCPPGQPVFPAQNTSKCELYGTADFKKVLVLTAPIAYFILQETLRVCLCLFPGVLVQTKLFSAPSTFECSFPQLWNHDLLRFLPRFFSRLCGGDELHAGFVLLAIYLDFNGRRYTVLTRILLFFFILLTCYWQHGSDRQKHELSMSVCFQESWY